MDLLTSLDPTAVCVTLLVVALSLLWCYVSVSGSRREQPNLSALYEQTTLRPSSGSAGQHRSPRASKAKGKGKQVSRASQLRAHAHRTQTMCLPRHGIRIAKELLFMYIIVLLQCCALIGIYFVCVSKECRIFLSPPRTCTGGR